MSQTPTQFSLNDFKQDFASTAFKTIDGERRIVGKFCEVTILDDGTFDIWIVRPDREPISKQKLTWLIKGIEALPAFSSGKNATIQELSGEAYLQTTDRSLVREVALLCGVKRKRQVSEATRQANAARLATYRERAA